MANHKIELAKVQRDQLEKQEQLNTHIQGSHFLSHSERYIFYKTYNLLVSAKVFNI